MRARRLPRVPELTARMAKAAFPKGTLAIRMRDELGELYGDTEFVPAFGVRGRSGISYLAGTAGHGDGVAVHRGPD
jgi:hypothetical protein